MLQRAVFCNPVKGGETVTVSGVVTSAEDKQPLIGVNVISGSATGVSTLADGSYSIEVAPGTTLIFQYIGYKPVEYIVPEGQTHVTFNLEMQSDSQALEDVVVIAYGVRKKGTIAGSVSTVKAERSKAPRRLHSTRRCRVRSRASRCSPTRVSPARRPS